MQFNPKLYLVTDSTYNNEAEFLKIIEEACKSGITLVQLREKNKTTREYIEIGLKVKNITDAHNIPLIIDDRVDVVLAIDASGVHVGAEDMPVHIARKILGKNKLIGATAKTIEVATKAMNDGADYLGVGAIYPTTTKVITKITKVSTLNDIVAAVNIPVVAIGGLNETNLDILNGSKIDGIAVVSAIMKSKQVEKDTKNLRQLVNNIVL
ncbi:thiamine-phosphate diphosphorylase [Candidatus Epulonipiscium fishelsonii]|uniref:Thiamine-phosphate diphosphorylase n=1 Tax=Candidatus Epulonipiscium fishelsonii TaxID=77094 RepID=A0ACC8XE92_9FIRM|nr:thiamine-phosphate diphosphorylase [Epulopiscium sp. SCG-D08WGA-EpuloA1]